MGIFNHVLDDFREGNLGVLCKKFNLVKVKEEKQNEQFMKKYL